MGTLSHSLSAHLIARYSLPRSRPTELQSRAFIGIEFFLGLINLTSV